MNQLEREKFILPSVESLLSGSDKTRNSTNLNLNNSGAMNIQSFFQQSAEKGVAKMLVPFWSLPEFSPTNQPATKVITYTRVPVLKRVEGCQISQINQISNQVNQKRSQPKKNLADKGPQIKKTYKRNRCDDDEDEEDQEDNNEEEFSDDDEDKGDDDEKEDEGEKNMKSISSTRVSMMGSKYLSKSNGPHVDGPSGSLKESTVDQQCGTPKRCQALNKQKNQPCRNYALLDYSGPAALYCAEHIHLDPNSMLQKCSAESASAGFIPRQKICKEIVLKEIGVCHKHMKDFLQQNEMFLQTECGDEAIINSQKLLDRINQILQQLKQDASSAKLDDRETFQRKAKLISKYRSMRHTLTNHLSQIQKKK